VTIATLTIHPLSDLQRFGVELDDRAQAWAFAVKAFDPLEVHFHEANDRQLACLEAAPKLVDRHLGQLGVRVGFVVHAPSVAQSTCSSFGRNQLRIEETTLGEAWMAIAAAILTDGVVGSWDGLPIVEVFRATLDVLSPRVNDPIIARHGDPERLAWMHANFTDHSRVAELGDSDSYATRLYDYAHAGRDQIRWVIDRLAANPSARDATITTFQPLTDTGYIPCVSLLDFWLVKGELQVAVYAHGIDFGTKGYANLVELAALQARVAGDLGVGIGTLTMTVKSAHIYQTELELMRRIIASTQA
jgi:thymidylate synthase